MTRYLISFDDGAMTFLDEDLLNVAKAAHEVVEQAEDAGVWVLGGGVKGHEASVVATDWSVTDGPSPESKEHLGEFAVVNRISAAVVLRARASASARGLPDQETVAP